MPRDEETISKIKEKEDLFNKITKHYPWSMGKFIEFIAMSLSCCFRIHTNFYEWIMSNFFVS